MLETVNHCKELVDKKDAEIEELCEQLARHKRTVLKVYGLISYMQECGGDPDADTDYMLDLVMQMLDKFIRI